MKINNKKIIENKIKNETLFAIEIKNERKINGNEIHCINSKINKVCGDDLGISVDKLSVNFEDIVKIFDLVEVN